MPKGSRRIRGNGVSPSVRAGHPVPTAARFAVGVGLAIRRRRRCRSGAASGTGVGSRLPLDDHTDFSPPSGRT
jgi:hypothetical protein